MTRPPLLAAAIVAAAVAQAAPAQKISLQDSFRIGTSGSAICTAQSMATGDALVDMFDRGWSVVCRDAAVPVAQLYALRSRGGDPLQRLSELRGNAACGAAEPATIEGLGSVEALSCTLDESGIPYRVYWTRQGGVVYVAEGFAGYDSALRVGLHTVIADAPVEGEVSVATTGAGDAAAFARVQAGALDPQRAMAEAYRRNNAGSFAESAEFFAALEAGGTPQARAEAAANEALQKSNLGQYGEADALFARAAELGGGDPVTARRLRNYRAMHALNRGHPIEAVAVLDRPLPQRAGVRAEGIRDLIIDPATAARLSAEGPGSRQLGGSSELTAEEKIQILDAQAEQLRGSALRLQGSAAAAETALNRALAGLEGFQAGRVAATDWLRAQILGELADLAERRGDPATAQARHNAAIDLLEIEYPGSSALLSAQGKLAGFHARGGRTAEATALYREIVRANAEAGNSSPTLRRVLAPYFELLARNGGDPAAAADLFAASQVLVRPGVAQTQAVLARELSGGSDEASRLFRQSVNLTRDIERARIELARLQALAEPSAADARKIAELTAQLDRLQADQVRTQSRLADFPRYRAVSSGSISLADMQGLLRAGEAYYKMTMVGEDAYAVFVTPAMARAFRIPASAPDLEREVDALRATISTVEDGQLVTYPFDVARAHALYGTLFGPVAGELAGVGHLIFEPDGAMLRLPPNLLVMDEAGVAAYAARAADPASDGFDFTGVEWLGRDRDISTAVSARAFRDVRNAPPSDARAEYIGFGSNAPAQAFFLPAAAAPAGDGGCGWSLAAWGRPISADELYTARQALAPGQPAEADIVTGEEFTDTSILRRDDLDQYRIMHFATHGLVTPPRPECPARPALMTSFGGEGSDGLLSFSEIFDLKLDADLVILSACDTAGRASLTATREAGITTGGDMAFDGLVRAFVGAGGRLVLASHWPVPDDFDATKRLISGLFTQAPGTATATALREAQLALMDDPATSHPYYWSGFAVVGDGASPVIRNAAAGTSTAN